MTEPREGGPAHARPEDASTSEVAARLRRVAGNFHRNAWQWIDAFAMAGMIEVRLSRSVWPTSKLTPRDANRAGNDERDFDRQWRWSGCYAPLTSMYFDQFGMVRACCQNTNHPIGDVQAHSLREIWFGHAADELRGHVRRGDFSLGCEFCEWQREEMPPESWFLQQFDSLPAGWRNQPSWPRQLEFALTNTCNLQCIMCNGDWSSLIRENREHREPLISAYPERFYDEIVEFIPHLERAAFSGGEPFLGHEPRRVMDLLLDHGSPALAFAVVTNGTVWSARVERMLSTFRPSIVVSFDGGTKEVYERIRLGASFEKVLANVDRFASILERRHIEPSTEVGLAHGLMVDHLSLSHCLMVDNWETFPDFLLLAEDRRLPVSINVVRFPEARSLYHLSPQDLNEVVTRLGARDREMHRVLTGNRLDVWASQLTALRQRAQDPTWPEALGVEPDNRISSPSVSVDLPTRR